MKKVFLLLLAVFAFTVSAIAQTQVRGTVVADPDDEPVIGATVRVEGTNISTVTDIEGNYRITAPAGAKMLVFSFVGMKSQTVPVGPVVNITMMQDTRMLDEVIVTGYGQTRKAAFTGAASVVDGNVIDRKADVNLVKSLEGQVTGFQYNNSTGMPGQWGSVYVRGMSSLSSSSQPLYVVDGMPVNSDYVDMGDSNNYFDPMSAYNPADIESVTVLKDASATAIYGSRASNGVIIITTKKGGEGKFNITFDMKQGCSSMANNNMKFANAAQSMDLFAKGFVARYGGDYADAVQYLTEDYFGWDGKTDTDWMDEVTRTAHFQDYNLSFNGTQGTTNYYVNLNYIDTDGIVIGSNNKRYSGRINLDTKYRYFTAGMNANYAYSVNNSFSQSTSGSMSAATVAAVSSMTPFDAPYVEVDGVKQYNEIPYNPLWMYDPKIGEKNEIKNETLNANPWLRVDFGYGIWAKTNFGVNIMNQRQYQYWSAISNPQGQAYNGLGQQYNSRTSTLTWTNTLGWTYSFNDVNSFNLLLGQEMQRYEFWEEYYAAQDFPFADEGMVDPSTAGLIDSGSYYKSQSRLASYFANAEYSYANRYYLSGSFRRDGSSIFGSDKRWGNFWSVGAKWRLSEESFLAGNTIITNADIRASYGTVGNQSLPSLYAARGYYAAGYNYHQRPGMVPSQISNPDLSWETAKKLDIGFDLSLFNRAHLTFDFYRDETHDALYSVPLSFTTGFASTYKNIGKIRNTGIELGVNGTVFQNRDITVNAFVNMSWNKNKVIKLADGAIESSYQIIEEGRPYRQFKMKEFAGVEAETGKPLYYLNEEGDETTTDWRLASKRYVGSAEPKVFGAFGVSARAYGFDLSMQFNYRTGNKVYDSGARFTGRGMSFRTPLEKVCTDSWTPENTSAAYPQYIYNDPNNATQASTRFLMPGDYLRLSNITFGYTVPRNLTEKIFIQKIRLYTTFDNVHTWTKKGFTGYNPETYANGVIAWQYPAVFTFTGGVQVTF